MLEQSTAEHYFDIKTVQLDMVRDRGYVIPDHEKHLLDSLNNFINYINDNREKNNEYWNKKGFDLSNVDNEYMTKLKALNNANKFDSYIPWQLYWNIDKTKVLLIYHIYHEKSIPVDFIRFLTNFNELIKKALFNIEISNVLISNNELSTDSKKNLILLPKSKFFLEDELKYNPVKNVTNQQHILLSPQEVTDLEKELKIDKSKLPDIKIDNPVVEYYGWEQGDVIKIVRTERHVNMIAKKSQNYRIVKELLSYNT